MKRLESVSRSPIYAFFGESLNGISTIRAFQTEKRFICRMQKHLDDNTRIFYSDLYGNRLDCFLCNGFWGKIKLTFGIDGWQ